MAGTCKYDNEPSGTMKCGEFIDQLGTVSFSRTLLHGSSKRKKCGGEQKY